MRPPQLAVVFVCNHDSQRNGGSLTYKSRKNYVMAQAFSLAHPYGTKRIMSSFAFDVINQGPPCDKHENILSPTFDLQGQCANGWICEHRWPEIASMVGFMNAIELENVTSWWDNGKNQIAFFRGSRGFIAFNLDSNDMNASVASNVPPGVYCDVISGKLSANGTCSGRALKVNAGGLVSVDLPSSDANGVVAIHIKKKTI